MHRIPRTTAVATMIALAVHCCLPALATDGATIEGTVQTPCDPSKVGEVASVQIQPVDGGSATTVPVDPSNGSFALGSVTEGEYELIAIGVDGEPLSLEPMKFTVVGGLNKVFLTMRPPGCDEQEPDRGKQKPRKGKKDGLENWQITLIYFGVVGLVALALDDDDDDDDEQQASPSQP
jgi:hypothetical protein